MSADFAMQVINQMWSSINKRLTTPPPPPFSLECRSVDWHPSRISRRHDDHSRKEIHLGMLRLYDYRQRYDEGILPSLRQPLAAQSLLQLRSEWRDQALSQERIQDQHAGFHCKRNLISFTIHSPHASVILVLHPKAKIRKGSEQLAAERRSAAAR